MAVLGKKGLFGLGSSLGGRGLISTPSNRALRAIFDGEGDLEATISQVSSMSATFDGEGEAEGTLSTISSLSAGFDGEGDVEGTITAGAFEFSNALEFDGTNDYVSIGSNLTIANNRTLNFWFKTNAFGDVIFHNSNFGFPYIQLANSTTITVATSGGANIKSFTVPTISIGTWYMCTIKFLTAGTRLYLNASESSSGAQTQTLSSNFSTIGANYGGTGFAYDGVLDEVSWYEADLTPTQITNQYNGGGGNYAGADVTPLLWYKFNETSGASTAVNSGSGGATYDGTLNNFDTSTCWVEHDPLFIDATGGTITTDGDYKIHTFNSSGTFTVNSVGGSGEGDEVEYLVVAGGGGGSNYGGGGAGGLLTGTGHSVTAQGYSISVGSGGVSGINNSTKGTNGGNSIFDVFTAIGGGAGGMNSASVNGENGGSGGGASFNSGAVGGTGSQGNNGGDGFSNSSPYSGAGGGGHSTAGQTGDGAGAGNGGDGTASSITGASVTYAGGGAGGSYSGAQALGGAGGGGNGGVNGTGVSNGTANTGGGGGGFGNTSTGGSFNGNGGSGVVIIRYKFQ